MEEALLLVPFSAVCYLLNCMPRLMKQGWDVEVLARTLSFVMKVHHEPIVRTKRLLPIVQQLKSLSIQTVDLERVRNKPSSFCALFIFLFTF
jgi:U3 small nucleolar RNA-associated protein 12